MHWSKKLVTITSLAILTSGLYACQRGDNTLTAGKTTPARPGAEGASVEGAVYLPAKTTSLPMGAPMEKSANLIFGDDTTGLETVLMRVRCTSDALKAIQLSSEPAFWIQPQSQIIARQNKSVQTPDGQEAQELSDFVSFVCKPAPPASSRRAAKPGVRAGGKTGKQDFAMFNAAASNAASEDEEIYDTELANSNSGDVTFAADAPIRPGVPGAASAPGAAQAAPPAVGTAPVASGTLALPSNVKALPMLPGGRLKLSIFHAKAQTAPQVIKVECLEKEKMASADQKLAPADPKTEIPDFVIATGFKAVVQTKLKDATPAEYQLVTCEPEVKKAEEKK